MFSRLARAHCYRECGEHPTVARLPQMSWSWYEKQRLNLLYGKNRRKILKPHNTKCEDKVEEYEWATFQMTTSDIAA